ncbi:MAG TPA: peptide deformylase [Candidatus Acidoferrum sp.]|nr:peptide deformylase [Candidatus Acidoferrum sp.]
MAIRKILDASKENNALRRKSRPVEKFDKRLADLLDDLRDTLYCADGAGLAAPQVGVLRRVAVVDIGDGLIELVNPVVVEKGGEADGVEGCLSVTGTNGYVIRPKWVRVEAFDRNGEKVSVEGTDFKARALCHEIDHLDGILFTDIMYAVYEPEPDEDEEN